MLKNFWIVVFCSQNISFIYISFFSFSPREKALFFQKRWILYTTLHKFCLKVYKATKNFVLYFNFRMIFVTNIFFKNSLINQILLLSKLRCFSKLSAWENTMLFLVSLTSYDPVQTYVFQCFTIAQFFPCQIKVFWYALLSTSIWAWVPIFLSYAYFSFSCLVTYEIVFTRHQTAFLSVKIFR